MKLCKIFAIAMATFQLYTPSLVAANTLLTSGKIFTMDSETPWAEAMVINGDKIQYVGSTEQAKSLLEHDGKVIDLQGRVVLPGLIDSHTHLGLVSALGGELEALDWNPPKPKLRTRQETLDDLNKQANDSFSPILILESFDTYNYTPGGPTKEELNSKIWRPTIVFDDSGHSFWLNSAALWFLGIDKDTPDISKGLSMFVRDEEGNPTGWVKEFALWPQVGDKLLQDPEDIKASMLTFIEFLNSRGITTLFDAGNFDWDEIMYGVMAELEKEGKLTLRVEGAYHIWRPNQTGSAVQNVRRLQSKFGSKNLNINTVKVHYDGVTEINTAAVLEPYENEQDSTGATLFSTNEMKKLMLNLSRNGINLHIHSVGDRATKNILDAMDLAEKELGMLLPINVTISHLEMVAPEDISRFNRPNLYANFTPHWFQDGENRSVMVAIGNERRKRSQMVQSLINAGANITLSSDVTVFSEAHNGDPFVGMQTAMTRQKIGRPNSVVLSGEKERINLEQAIDGYTLTGAKQLTIASKLGSLEAGKAADFVVLDKDVFSADKNELAQINPVLVYKDGVEIYRR